MEIQRSNKIFRENVVYTKEQLLNRLKKDYSPNLYVNSWYKQTPSGPEAFSLPEMHQYNMKMIPLLPSKFTCDIWVNEDLEIESVLFKSVWEDEENVPFEEWLEDIEEKIRKNKQLLDEAKLLQDKMAKLCDQRREIKNELEKFQLYCC